MGRCTRKGNSTEQYKTTVAEIDRKKCGYLRAIKLSLQQTAKKNIFGLHSAKQRLQHDQTVVVTDQKWMTQTPFHHDSDQTVTATMPLNRCSLTGREV
jgi:hypothetical protein